MRSMSVAEVPHNRDGYEVKHDLQNRANSTNPRVSSESRLYNFDASDIHVPYPTEITPSACGLMYGFIPRISSCFSACLLRLCSTYARQLAAVPMYTQPTSKDIPSLRIVSNTPHFSPTCLNSNSNFCFFNTSSMYIISPIGLWILVRSHALLDIYELRRPKAPVRAVRTARAVVPLCLR